MRKKIEKIILDEVKSVLAEYDIENEVKKRIEKAYVNKRVKEIIEEQITQQTTRAIELSIYDAIHKHIK